MPLEPRVSLRNSEGHEYCSSRCARRCRRFWQWHDVCAARLCSHDWQMTRQTFTGFHRPLMLPFIIYFTANVASYQLVSLLPQTGRQFPSANTPAVFVEHMRCATISITITSLIVSN
jgi:hypothetical protein